MTTLFSQQKLIAKTLLYLLILSPLTAMSQDTAFNVPESYCGNATIWNGSSWSNGQPDESKDAVFSGNYTFSSATFNACALYVLEGAQVSFCQNSNAVIVHNVHVSGTGQLTFESGSNLVQHQGIKNTGIVTIKRNSSLIKKDAFTLWSSPVSGQSLLNFSPETLTNRFYTFSTADNIYNTVSSPATTMLESGKGYLIRTGENHPETPAVWEGYFSGIPHTGDITVPLNYISANQSYNAVGNPYPSPISVMDFLEENEEAIDGTIWLWRKTDDPEKSSYCAVTKLGYQANSAPNPENPTIQNPFEIINEGLLNTAQGFIVKANENQALTFKNSMRRAVSSQIFFRSETPQKNNNQLDASRYWINVTAESVFSQALIGYSQVATNGYDTGIDGEAIMDGTVTLYTIADNKKLAIQGRDGFEANDIVKIGFKTSMQGTYSLSLDHMDGIFASGQHVFIKDKKTGLVHNLNQGGPYSFTSAAGTFEDRFEIVYSDAMGIDNPSLPKKVIVYSNNQQIKIQSQEQIEAVAAYDLAGRLIFQQDNVRASEFASLPVNTAQVLIIKTTLANGLTVSEKLLVQ